MNWLGDRFVGKIALLAMTVKLNKNSRLIQRREQCSRDTTLIPTPWGRHSLDDQHHPVLITKNNLGFPTLSVCPNF